jgi:hypothetical protein
MRFDPKTHELKITLSAFRRFGLWSASIKGRGRRPLKIAGKLPADASSHTLLAVSLLTSFRSISKSEVARLMQTSRAAINRPRVSVATTDPTFAAALTSKMVRQDGPVLRTGRNFVTELARQVARFHVEFDPTPDDIGILELQNFAIQTIHDPSEQVPPAFQPLAVAEEQ